MNDEIPTLDFYALPKLARTYPKPSFTMLPVTTGARSVGCDQYSCDKFKSRFLENDAITTLKGRYAILYALKIAKGINGRGSVLMPSYHCPSMVEPAVMVGARPIFYKMTDQLMPDFEVLKKTPVSSVIAIVLVHYFGRVIDFTEIINWAKSNDIFVIEDCAHAFGATGSSRLPGIQGDFAVASSAKFFPGGHGGRIVQNGNISDLIGFRLNLKQELRDFKSLLFNQRPQDLEIIPATAIREKLEGIDKDIDLVQPTAPCNKEVLHWCKSSEALLANTGILNAVIRCTNKEKLVSSRRTIFERIKEVVSSRPDMAMLFSEFKPDIPYVVPVVLSRPERQFPWLKYARVPVWRWEEVAVSDCKFTRQLKNSLIQLPCHQGMSDQQVDWLIGTIQQMPLNGC